MLKILPITKDLGVHQDEYRSALCHQLRDTSVPTSEIDKWLALAASYVVDSWYDAHVYMRKAETANRALPRILQLSEAELEQRWILAQAAHAMPRHMSHLRLELLGLEE